MAVLTRDVASPQSPLEFVTANDWVLIRAGSRQLKFEKGEEIIRQDSTGGILYFLRTGKARIEANGVTVAVIGAGQICGEVAFLDSRRSSASVIAEETVEADAIDWSELQRIFRMFPHVGARFYHSLAVLLSKRLRETSGRLADCRTR
jgi:CRP/FNR family cyclic AMP-dependent transcriptional regulator